MNNDKNVEGLGKEEIQVDLLIKKREDLDYLVSIKRKKNEIEKNIHQNEIKVLRDHAKILNEEEINRLNLHNSIRKNVMLNNVETINHKKELNSNERMNNLKEQSSLINYLNQLKVIEEKKREEDDQIIKNFKKMEYQNYLISKKQERDRKAEEIKENQHLINEQIQKSIERENEFKNKINTMENNIFHNVNKYNEYFYQTPIRNNTNISSQFLSPDIILNRKLAEMKKENPQEKENRIKERIKDEEKYKYLMDRERSESENNKKLYKDFLDLQIIKKHELNSKFPIAETTNQTILPSYFHENRPIATYKKAADTISMMKKSGQLENPIDYLNLGKFNDKYYAWETQLHHNPITHPLLDINHNKYLTKSVSQKKLKEDSSHLQNAGNAIIN